jgi:uncharacterized membrane protein YjjP (DUF1212 family)
MADHDSQPISSPESLPDLSPTSSLSTAVSEVGALADFMSHLGQAYLACGEQTAIIEMTLRKVAAANGVDRSKVVAFPTAIMLSLSVGDQERVALAECPTQSLRLDQIAAVYRLGEAAEQGQIEPRQGIQNLRSILRQPSRFGFVGAVGGHVVLSVGLALVLTSAWLNLLAAALLGAIVGIQKASNRDRPVMSIPLPVFAALLVSTVVFLAIDYGFEIEPIYVLIPPLVTFLPGARLTLGMVELAYGDMVSGSSRLMTGFVQLLLLAIGLTVGAMLVGYTAADLVDRTPAAANHLADEWASWLGVSVFALGIYFHFSAPRGSLLWMLVVMLVAVATQRFSAGWVGTTASGFFGMMVVTPLSYLIQFRFNGPPAMVTFLPGFWILVPGALSLVGVKHMLSDREAGIDGMTTALFAIVSIALGTLVGASIYKGLSDTYGWSRLQLIRAMRGGLRKRKKS